MIMLLNLVVNYHVRKKISVIEIQMNDLENLQTVWHSHKCKCQIITQRHKLSLDLMNENGNTNKEINQKW